MGFNLSAFIGGAAERGSEMIAEEREQQRNIVAGRLKKAAESKATYQKQVEAEKAALRDTYNTLSQFSSFNDLTKQQQTAILSSSSIANDFVERQKSGNPFNVDQVYKFKGDEATVMSPQEYIDKVGQGQPAADMTQQMQGFGTGRRRRDADEIASVYGDTPEGLASFEGRTVADRAPMASFAEGAFAKPETLEARLEKARKAFADATTPEDREAAEDAARSIQAAMAVGQNPKDLKAYADKLSMQVMNASTPEAKQAAQAKLNRVNAQIRSNGAAQAQEKETAGKNSLTYPQLRGAVDRRIEEDLIAKFGLNAIREGKIIEYIKDEKTGETRQVLRSPKAEMLPKLQAAKKKAIIDFLTESGRINLEENFISDFAKEILVSENIKIPSLNKKEVSVDDTADTTKNTKTSTTAGQPKQPVKESNPIPDFKDIDKNVTADSSFALQKLIEGDTDEAYRQFAKDQNNPESLYGLGRILYEGRGGARNIEKGLQSLRAAAKRGSKEAQEYLKRIGQ